ncbi:MAG: SGNH/GDSL hydrolase family protein [Verrucomicrobiae bacterium]|nr:SGNH/GDSL hydrolase family protein [Verrucomicrobiae bacterium]
MGNSYTYADDIPWITQQLAASAKTAQPLEAEMIAPLGATLQGQWEAGVVMNRLHQTNWDYVVLQEQSQIPIQAAPLMAHYARLFDGEIKANGARTILFLTWPRQQQPENLAALTNTIFAIAKELNAIVAPVGIVWSEVLKQRPSLAIYHQDGSHPNPIGSYIAGCVFYSVLYGKSPVGLSRTLYTAQRDGGHKKMGELSKADAMLIQQITWQVVQSKQPKHSEIKTIAE